MQHGGRASTYAQLGELAYRLAGGTSIGLKKSEVAMLIERGRNLIIGIMLGLLASCGGGGGSPGTPAPVQRALALTISGLPAGVEAPVRVTGSGGFSQEVPAGQTLNALAVES